MLVQHVAPFFPQVFDDETTMAVFRSRFTAQ